MREEDREYWTWEFVRRSDDYAEDFKRCGGKELKGNVADAMIEKWHTRDLPDPKEPLDLKNYPYDYPISYFPMAKVRIGSLCWDWDHWISLLKPGTVLKRKGHIAKKFKEWTVFDHDTKTFEPLNEYTCPTSITITLAIEPHFKEGDVKKLLREVFDEAYGKVSIAQRKIFGSKPSRLRVDQFKKYLSVWDARMKDKKKWFEIAKEVFPEYFEGPKKEPVVARDLVRHYYKQADKMINRGGWIKI